MKSFNVYAGGMGLLSAFYWIHYAPLQSSMWTFYRSFWPAKLLLLGSFLCSLGCLIFAFVFSFLIAVVGRTLMETGQQVGILD